MLFYEIFKSFEDQQKLSRNNLPESLRVWEIYLIHIRFSIFQIYRYVYELVEWMVKSLCQNEIPYFRNTFPEPFWETYPSSVCMSPLPKNSWTWTLPRLFQIDTVCQTMCEQKVPGHMTCELNFNLSHQNDYLCCWGWPSASLNFTN